MAESLTVHAVHAKTKLVTEIPRHYLDLYPELFTELSEDEVVGLRRKEEKKMFGEYITPEKKPTAAAKPVEAPTKEGGK